MSEWFIEKPDSENEDDVVGPLKPSELLEMVRDGEITRETMIRKDDSAWFAASDVGGLFEAAIRPTIHYFCPQCDTQVTEPPVICPKCLRDIRKAREETIENTIKNKDAPQKASRSVQNWLRKRVRKDRE